MEISRNLLSNYSNDEVACFLSHWDDGPLISLIEADSIISKCDNKMVDFLLEHSIWSQYGWELAAAYSPPKLIADASRLHQPGIIRKITRIVYDSAVHQAYVETVVSGRGWSKGNRGSMYPMPTMNAKIAMDFYRGAATAQDFSEYCMRESAKLAIIDAKEESDLATVCTEPAQFIETSCFDEYAAIEKVAAPMNTDEPAMVNPNQPVNYESPMINDPLVPPTVAEICEFANKDNDPDFVVIKRINQTMVSTVYAGDDIRLFVLDIPKLNGYKFIYEGEEVTVTTDMRDEVAAAAMINYVYGAGYARKSPEARSVFGMPYVGQYRFNSTGYFGEILPDRIYYAWDNLVSDVKWRSVFDRVNGFPLKKEAIYWRDGLRQLLQKYSFECGNIITGGLEPIGTGLFNHPLEVDVNTAKRYDYEIAKERRIGKKMYKDLDHLLFLMHDMGLSEEKAFRYLVSDASVLFYCYHLSTYERPRFFPKSTAALIVNESDQMVSRIGVELLRTSRKLAEPNECLPLDAARITIMDYTGWETFSKRMATIRPNDNHALMLRLQDQFHYVIPRLMQFLHDKDFSSRYCKNDVDGEGSTHYLIIGSRYAFPRLKDELASLLRYSHFPSTYGFEFGSRTREDYTIARSLLAIAARFFGARDREKNKIDKKFAEALRIKIQ